jgi:hypothetical protein
VNFELKGKAEKRVFEKESIRIYKKLRKKNGETTILWSFIIFTLRLR